MVAGDRCCRWCSDPLFCFAAWIVGFKTRLRAFCTNPCVASQRPPEPARVLTRRSNQTDLIANEQPFGDDLRRRFFLKGAFMPRAKSRWTWRCGWHAREERHPAEQIARVHASLHTRKMSPQAWRGRWPDLVWPGIIGHRLQERSGTRG